MSHGKPSISGGWTGLRLSVAAPPGRSSLPIAPASFTIGANCALNFDRFRELAPQVDPDVVPSFLLDA